MEQILIGTNKEGKIILVIYKNYLFKIDPNNLSKSFDKIDKVFPGFKQSYFKPGSTRILTKKELDKYLEKISNQTNKQITQKDNPQKLEQKINKDLQSTNIKNTKIHERLINRCKEDIFTGKQIKLKHSEYSLGNTMYASQDIGKMRKNQEDSVLILQHPLNKDFKLLAVSDGVGGRHGGELASRCIVAKLTQWFENLNPNIYNDIEQVKTSLNNMLPHILEGLVAPEEASATLSAVVIGKNQTLITNIGDSRVYSMKNNKIIQETIDDSKVQKLFESKQIPDKELMRFNNSSNMITNSVSKAPTDTPNFKIINNSSYDRIIATSDGVTDCMSEKELEKLMKTKNKEKMTSNIVNYALKNNSYLDQIKKYLPKEKRQLVIDIKNDPNYSEKIPGGKDNTTVAAYIKK